MLARLTLSRSRIVYTIAVPVICFLSGLCVHNLQKKYRATLQEVGANSTQQTRSVYNHSCSGSCAHDHSCSSVHNHSCSKGVTSCAHQHLAPCAHTRAAYPTRLPHSSLLVLYFLYLKHGTDHNQLLRILSGSHCCFCGRERLYMHWLGHQVPHLTCCPCSAMYYSKISYLLLQAR